MYASYIGRRLIDLHNERLHEGEPRSPRAFFDEVFFPLFFDHDRYLMWVNNSKFDQAYKQRKKTPLTAEVRQEALTDFHTDTAELDEPHGHLYLGGTARGVTAPTSGQVTDVSIPVDADEVYCSWIGAALGIGVEGGFSMLIDDDQVLETLFEGWTAYRQYMDDTPNLKAHQVDTWNGWWLAHRFDEEFDAEFPLVDFDPKTKAAGKGRKLDTKSWVEVLFALAKQRREQPLTAYVYTFGNTNKTIGFVQLDLPRVAALRELYRQLFGRQGGVSLRELDKLYRTERGFRQACQQGRVGLKAIEPKALRKYMAFGRGKSKVPKQPKKEKDIITYQIYQTWIIAMLDNQKLLDLAQQTAEALHEFSQSGKRGKTTPRRQVDNVLKTGSRRAFIEELTEVVEADNKEQFDRLVAEVMHLSPTDFPLLLALIKFKRAVIKA